MQVHNLFWQNLIGQKLTLIYVGYNKQTIIYSDFQSIQANNYFIYILIFVYIHFSFYLLFIMIMDDVHLKHMFINLKFLNYRGQKLTLIYVGYNKQTIIYSDFQSIQANNYFIYILIFVYIHFSFYLLFIMIMDDVHLKHMSTILILYIRIK